MYINELDLILVGHFIIVRNSKYAVHNVDQILHLI